MPGHRRMAQRICQEAAMGTVGPRGIGLEHQLMFPGAHPLHGSQRQLDILAGDAWGHSGARAAGRK